MNKETFLARLTEALSAMDAAERERTVQYYREILEDRMEEGLSEREAVAEMEPVEEIAARLLSDQAPAPRKKRARWTVVLLAAGSPVWLPLLLALGIVVLCLLIAAWAVVLSLCAVTTALSLCLIAGIGCLFLLLSGGYPLTGVFLLGAGLLCAALGTALFFPIPALSKLLLRGTLWPFHALWGRLFQRRPETI